MCAVPTPNLPPYVATPLELPTSLVKVTYWSRSILQPVLGFNANTVPLIVGGPQFATQAVGTSTFTGVLTPGSFGSHGHHQHDRSVRRENVTGCDLLSGTTIQAINSLFSITLSTTFTGPASFTGVVTPGSSLVTGIASTMGFFVGETVAGTNITSGTTIEAINSSSEITLSTAFAGPAKVSESLAATVSESLTAAGPVATSSDNLLTDDTTSQYDVTFDRPVQASSFTPSQVLQITGPTGSVLSPQTFGSTSIDQNIPAATTAGAGTLDSTLTVDSDDTLEIADITVTLTIASPADGELTAILVAPNGDTIPLFSAVGGTSDLGFVNTTFDDSVLTPITAGTAPFTGSFHPEYSALPTGVTTLTDLEGMIADGTWKLDQRHHDRRRLHAGLVVADHHATGYGHAVNPSSVTVNGVSETVATEFSILFPQQEVSGTYTIQLGPDILDQFGDGQDPTEQRGPRCGPRRGTEWPDDHQGVQRPQSAGADRRDHDLHGYTEWNTFSAIGAGHGHRQHDGAIGRGNGDRYRYPARDDDRDRR